MTPTPNDAPAWVSFLPLLFIGLAILRNARVRNLNVSRLWIAPTLILGATVLLFAQQKHLPGPLMIAGDVATLLLGASLGWWRGRTTRISVDPETHSLTSQASPVGMVLLLVIFGLRYAVRAYADQSASLLHVSAVELADALMLLAVGLVCAQRLELALRAIRLLNEARGRPG